MDITIDQALDRWEWVLKAERKSERTIETYLHAANQLRQWLAEQGHSLKVGDTKTDLTRIELLDTSLLVDGEQVCTN